MKNINKKYQREGMEFINKEGCIGRVIKYNNRKDVYVEIQDKYKAIIHNEFKNFCKGKFHNPYYPTIYNIGIIGNVKTTENNKPIQSYKVWNDMIKRCYNDCYKGKSPTYKDCFVCEEWLLYENFKKWYDENYYEVNDEKMNLDKDILFKGNKIYSPTTCCFVPFNINALFIKSNKTRGKYPLGVRYNNKKFEARLSKNNHTEHVASFPTIKEAFYAYKIAKEKYIKEIADFYKDKIPNKVYEAMYNYKVDITD